MSIMKSTTATSSSHQLVNMSPRRFRIVLDDHPRGLVGPGQESETNMCMHALQHADDQPVRVHRQGDAVMACLVSKTKGI